MEGISEKKKRILAICNDILDLLLEFRKNHPDFTFSLRSRDSVQSDEERLSVGQWFQGSEYIYVPLFKKGDGARKLKTIGFAISFNDDGSILNNYIEISFKSGVDDPAERAFHKELAEAIGLKLNIHNHGTLFYSDPDRYSDNLEQFLTEFRPLALSLLRKHGIEKDYIIPESDFERQLARTLQIRKGLGEDLNPKIDKMSKGHPLNLILYGPPGTGKTYHTINRAVLIADQLDEEELLHRYPQRAGLKKRFDELLIDDWENPEGQIGFITFHQSMSYEDFIEGIKPDTNDDRKMIYELNAGVFKNIANLARNNWLGATSGVSGQLTFEAALEKCKEEWEENRDMKFPLRREGKDYTILGFTRSSIRFRKASGGTGHTLSIAALREYFYNRREVKLTGVGIYYPGILQKLRSYQPDRQEERKVKNFVLIIDEINRGNVSQIFGELITLIEEDKRLGMEEALELTLPYSREKFGVPPNLYIIGTMNTADRSVEALDAALRRRFSFEEMPPQPELIAREGKSKAANGIVMGFRLPMILSTINRRIEKLLDSDHQIGHSYFMQVAGSDDLKTVFQNKIIPLLREYFFGDYGKIGLILGRGFVETAEADRDVFAFFDDADIQQLAERPIYKIKNPVGMADEEFLSAISTLLNQ